MPSPADLVCDFVNTYDVESDADALPSPAALAAWLVKRGLAAPGDAAGEEDLDVAVHLRETLRATLRRHHAPGDASGDTPDTPDDASGGPSGALSGDGDERGSALSHALDRLPVVVVLTSGDPGLEPVAGGVPGGLARIAAAVMAVHAQGMWPRLKVCTESTCQWAFVDSSKNRSRSWCSMKVCGNRTKTRAYRARRQSETGSRHP
ncbi:CGNR zinc finger domain-containing protein [Planobispora takensis]|uniref:Zinc finger CGNR domain-containing protein n=1 Tax=Planobispora takensis TaxID=1367882 RepID=A0A8J3SR09_9ACTN|nr:CGNR zinc finger domain-containing protein [Planobispora takensis]GIH98692.1 hypothetical protein Pta02_07010 [Planobispora takensis]